MRWIIHQSKNSAASLPDVLCLETRCKRADPDKLPLKSWVALEVRHLGDCRLELSMLPALRPDQQRGSERRLGSEARVVFANPGQPWFQNRPCVLQLAPGQAPPVKLKGSAANDHPRQAVHGQRETIPDGLPCMDDVPAAQSILNQRWMIKKVQQPIAVL